MNCPRCNGTAVETNRHYVGRLIYVIETRCTDCGHYEAEETT